MFKKYYYPHTHPPPTLYFLLASGIINNLVIEAKHMGNHPCFSP